MSAIKYEGVKYERNSFMHSKSIYWVPILDLTIIVLETGTQP